MPLALICVLMLAVGGYAASKSSAFLTEFNLNGLLLATLPLALVAMGQLNVLLLGDFDISVGQTMTLCVVIASFIMTSGSVWYVMLVGALALIAIGIAVGLFNSSLIQVIGLPSIIGTLATLSVLQGISLALRPIPAGFIDSDLAATLRSSVGFVPFAFIAIVVLAILWDVWLYRRPGGLTTRAVGLDKISGRRLGAAPGRTRVRAFMLSGLMASFGALFLMAQVGVGDARVGQGFALTSIAAAVLGGASLVGGRGSFIGALVGALFLSLIINVLPFIGWSAAYGQIAIGALTLLALIAYQGPELYGRLSAFIAEARGAAIQKVPS
jgi:ribose transport system ATP-binding protein